jgi:hypothetical protein
MVDDLLEQFLAQECSLYVRQLLQRVIADTSVVRPHLQFNRFEVTVERHANMVLLEDVLDATETGTQRVPLSRFMQVIELCS